MSKGYSFTNEPFLSFATTRDSMIYGSFCHDRLLSVNISQYPSKGALELNGWLSGKGNNLKHEEQLKIWFPVWSRGGTFYFKAAGSEYKFLYDDGVHIWRQKEGWNYNPFVCVQFTNQLKNIVLKAGTNIMGTQWSFGSRIRYGLNQGKGQVSIAKRIEWVQGQWSFAGYKAVNMNTLTILTNAMRIGYTKGDNQFSFTAEQNDHRDLKRFKLDSFNSYFNFFKADWLRRVNESTRVALESQFTANGLGDVHAAIRRTIPGKNAVWKLRLSSNKSFAMSYKSEIKEYGSWTLGLQISDLGKSNMPKYGAQFDLNL